jgi:hypothetical protein
MCPEYFVTYVSGSSQTLALLAGLFYANLPYALTTYTDQVYFSQLPLTPAAKSMGWNPLIELGLAV